MAICFDGDFQSFIRQAGKNEANILFLPANDWREIAPYHTNMAIRRAIENGFSLVHPTGQGLSVAADNRGRIISTMDFYKTDKQIMYASVPFYTSPALYAQTGDVFAWLCISVFIGIIISVALFFGFSNSKMNRDNTQYGIRNTMLLSCFPLLPFDLKKQHSIPNILLYKYRESFKGVRIPLFAKKASANKLSLRWVRRRCDENAVERNCGSRFCVMSYHFAT